MRSRVLLLAVLSVAATLLPARPAAAARGFSWVRLPETVSDDVRFYVRATWHADYADPRCPKEPYIDEYPEDHHVCGGGFAEIGVLVDGRYFVRRGMDKASPDHDNYADDVVGECIDDPSEGWVYGPDPDTWVAIWTQQIAHRPDHHDIDTHQLPESIRRDVRTSGQSSPVRCDYSQWIGRAR